MKNRIFIFVAVIGMLFTACDSHEMDDSLNNLDTNSIKGANPDSLYAQTEYNLDMRDFAMAVNEAINTNKSFRKLVKTEVNKMFDGDYNVLLSQMVDAKVDKYEQQEKGKMMKVPGKMTVRDLLNSSFQKVQKKANNIPSRYFRTPSTDLIGALTEQYPKLQVAVPFLEEQLEDENYIPPVVFLPEEYSEQTTEYLPAIRNNEVYAQNAKILPDSACIVISMNERMLLNTKNDVPPPPPTDLVAKKTDFGIELDWTMPSTTTEINTYGYKIYRSINNDDYSLLYTNNNYMNRSYKDSNLEFNKTYRYYVVAYNDFGVSSAVYNGSGIVISTRPATAKSFEVNPIAPNKIKFNWEFADSDNNGTIKIFQRNYGPQIEYPQTPLYSAQLPVENLEGNIVDACIINNIPAGARFEYRMSRTTPIGNSAPKYDVLFMPYRDVSSKSSVYIKRVKISKRAAVESWRGAPEYKIKMWRVKKDGTNLTVTEESSVVLHCNSKDDNKWETFNRQIMSDWKPGEDGATWYDRLSFYVIELDDDGKMTNIANSVQAASKIFNELNNTEQPDSNSSNKIISKAPTAINWVEAAVIAVTTVASQLPQWVKSEDEQIGWTYLNYYDPPNQINSINALCGGAVFSMEFSDKAN